LAKVNRKKQYFDKALKQIYLVAEYLETVADPEATYTPVVPVLKFSDGLPRDEMNDAQMVAVRTGSKPTMSQKTAIMLLDGKTEEQADAEIERMESENETPDVGDPEMFNSITGLSTPEEDGQEEEVDEPEATAEET